MSFGGIGPVAPLRAGTVRWVKLVQDAIGA
jgi:hypothetical protein